MAYLQDFRKFVIAASIILVTLPSFAQKYKADNKDSILSLFLTSEKVIARFSRCTVADSGVLVILDPNHLLGKSNMKTWLGHDVKVIDTGSTIDSIGKYDAHFIFKTQNNIFILRERKINNEVTLYIHFPFNNIIVTAQLRKNKAGFYLDKFESGAL